LKKLLKPSLHLIFAQMIFSGALMAQTQGDGGTAVQGAVGTSGTADSSSGITRCDQPMGAMAVVEPQSYVMSALASYNLQSPVSVIRMMIQQSNCFIVVERGQAMQNLQQERELSNTGLLRQDSNIGGGQMVGADFILTPNVVFSDGNAGGVGGGIGGAIGGLLGGRAGRAIGGIAGGVKFKEAQTSMMVTDARSGVQVAAAEGSAKQADLSLGGFLGGVGGGAALGGYNSTDEGKVIVASLVDNYNNIVGAVRNDPNLQRNVGTLAEEAAQGGAGRAGDVFEEGDILSPKIGNVRIMSSASDGSDVVANLARDDQMIYMGEEKDGFVYVESGQGGGWVKKLLVQR
jgi:hypothetical protein